MARIVCYHCFAEFEPGRLRYRCLMCKPPVLFAADLSAQARGGKHGTPPRSLHCPECGLETGYRACPSPTCGQDLPYYVGRSRQQIVAVTGWSFAGKTLYLWSLLHQLREKLSQDPEPFAVAMFEDPASFQIYHKLCQTVLLHRQLPDKTEAQRQKNEGIAPVVVRLLRARGGTLGLRNLIFYDPAGELIQNLQDTYYLRYLARASAIIYLVEPPTRPPEQMEQQAVEVAEGLGAIVRQIREENQVLPQERLPQVLAVAMTKCDRDLFGGDGSPQGWVAGLGRSQKFWSRPGWSGWRELRRVSQRCEEKLRERGCSELVTIARHNFARVAFFALSSLGRPPVGENVPEEPQPVGVEGPLFWALQQLS